MKYDSYVKIILVVVLIILLIFASLLIQPFLPGIKQQLTTVPSPQFVYCTMLIAVLNFVWSPFLYILGKKDKLNEKLITFREELLSKKIIIPICVEPLTNFVEKETSNIFKLHSLTGDRGKIEAKHREYIDYFKREKSKIINKFMIIGSIDKSVYKFISEEVDSLEDFVVEYCALNIVGNQNNQREKKYEVTKKAFYDSYSKILSHFISQYDRIVVRQ